MVQGINREFIFEKDYYKYLRNCVNTDITTLKEYSIVYAAISDMLFGENRIVLGRE